MDLGTLNWTRNEFASGGFYYFRCAFPNIAYGKSGSQANVVCPRYKAVGVGTASLSADKTITTYSTQSLILIRDDSYTDAATFKSAMSGVYLVYELATPTDQPSITLPENIEFEKGGSLEVTYDETAPTPADFDFEVAVYKPIEQGE